MIQEDADHVTVIYVPRPGANDDSLQTVRQHLQDLLGPVSLNLKKVDRIPRGSNGKFRWVVSRV